MLEVPRWLMRSASVVFGGALGALARWGVTEVVAEPNLALFPLATLIVNVTGAFLLGAAGVLFIERIAGKGNLRAFLLIGLLGSYTTFSTMALEGVLRIDSGEIVIAGIYWVTTLMFGQMAGASGMWLGRERIRA